MCHAALGGSLGQLAWLHVATVTVNILEKDPLEAAGPGLVQEH